MKVSVVTQTGLIDRHHIAILVVQTDTKVVLQQVETCKMRLNPNEWDKINALYHTINWITNGVPIIFSEPPTPFELHNPSLSVKYSKFITVEISRLLLVAGTLRSFTERQLLEILL